MLHRTRFFGTEPTLWCKRYKNANPCVFLLAWGTLSLNISGTMLPCVADQTTGDHTQARTTRQNGNFGLSAGLIFALTNGRFKWHTKLRDNISDATQQL
jgi:hypothetical protein